MNNSEIANALDEIAEILEFQGANPFRVRAYRNASRLIHDLPEPIAAIAADKDRKLTDIQGIGKDLAAAIATMLETGQLPLLEQLRSEVPPSVLKLLRIPGVGPKKAALLYKELKVSSLEELRAACEQQLVRGLKGFGAKTEATILAGLEMAASPEVERMYWAEADRHAQSLVAHLVAGGGVDQVELAGSFRRGRETVGDLDILVISTEVDRVMDRLGAYPSVAQVLGRGDTKMSVRLGVGLQVDLRIVPPESFGAALQYFTGSKDHNVQLRGLAKERGLKINEYGVFKIEEGQEPKYIAGRTEADVYATLDMPRFPPEIREARFEFDWAAKGPLPKLIELEDLRGDLHMHTTESDGSASLQEMVLAAKQRGLKYIAITDHSKRVTMARGLDGSRLRRQWEQIDRANEDLRDFRILKGVEVDILERGGLDLEDDVLSEADWVMASVHYGQNQPREQITKRILDALANPYVSGIAHPTGRIINRRKPYDVDLEAMMEATKKHGKFLELNANPARLDLNDVACTAARRMGIPIVISSDAHSTEGLDVLRYGILQARRGGLTAADVANTRDCKKMLAMLGKKR